VSTSEPRSQGEPPAEPAPSSRIPGAAAWAALPRRTRALIAGGALLGIVLFIWVAASGQGPDRGSSTPDRSPAAAASPGEGPQVPPLNGCPLLTDAEIEEAMGLLDIPWEERILIEYSGGEGCTWIHSRNGVDVEGLSIRIGPGAVDDFQAGAQLEGVSGEPVTGIGQLAVWFGADRSGTLSVTTESSLGYLFVRVTVARPDLEASDILPVARDLATAALPRFPGMEGEAAEPVTTIIEHEPPDMSNVSWVDNLLAKEESGEWTRGEGLVATLKVFVGELDADEVLLHPELVDDSGTGTVSLAQAYLQDGPDAAARSEIARLLGLLILSREELEALSGAGQPSVELVAHRVPSGPAVTRPLADICEEMGVASPCLIEYGSAELDALNELYGEGSHVVYLFSNYDEAGWTDDRLRWVVKALSDSAKVYAPLAPGRLPPVDVLITALGGPHLTTYVADTCSINVNRPMQGQPEAHFKQRIAQQMAFCLFSKAFPGAYEGSGSSSWWADGLAWHLSNSVYPATNLEWDGLPQALAAQELQSDLFHRTAPNALFFQHMWWLVGDDDDIMRLIRTLPPGGGSAGHAAAAAGYPNMPSIFHEFAKRLTNSSSQIRGGIGDTGGGTVPYDPEARDISISSAPNITIEHLVPFQAVRLAIDVAAGQKACVEYEHGGTNMTSWRPGYAGAEGVQGGWSNTLPAIIEGELVLVVTTTQPGESITLTATKLIPEDESECDPPPTPAASGCLPIICEPSAYFRSLTQLPTWFHGMLD